MMKKTGGIKIDPSKSILALQFSIFKIVTIRENENQI